MRKYLTLAVVFLVAVITINAQTADSTKKANEMTNQAKELYNAGNKLLKSGDYNGAIKKYDEALQNSEDYRILYQKSIALKKLRKYKDAEKTLLHCINVNPDFASEYNGLGTTYYALKEYQKAIDAFKKFQEKSDKPKLKKRASLYLAIAYTKLADVEKRKGRKDKAINLLNEAVSNNPYDASYLMLAELYNDQGEYQKALDAANNALKHRGRRSRISKGAIYYYKGLALKGLGKKEEAKTSFKLALTDRQYKQNAKYELKMLNR